MNRACFATCLLCCLATFANAKDPSVSFELRTDRNIPYNEWNDVSAVENNVLVAIENGVVVDRFTTKEAEIIEMLSVDDGTVKNISKMEFFGLFPAYRSVIVYDTAVVGKVCRVYESLRLRADENMSSSIMRTMKAGEYVRVLEVGKKETIDEIPGNWCYVEMVRPKYERDLKTNVEPTGVKGWCFSGYLK